MVRLITVAVVTAPALMANAHHSPARFQEDQIVAVHGEVMRVDWRNPHVYFTLRDDDGTEWLFETNATSNLRRLGWTRDSIAPGDRVTTRAHANVDPEKTHVMLRSVSLSDGTVLPTRLPDSDDRAVVARSTDSLDGTWIGSADDAFAFLFAFFDHPKTEKALAAMDRYDESMDPAADCVVWPTPRLVAWAAFYPVTLALTDDALYFRSEYGRTERVIHLDGRAHPDDGPRTGQGHSIGTWEGDTLVVETTLLADNISPVGAGIPAGAARRVIERYTLGDAGTTLEIDIRVEDPDYLAEPFTSHLRWHYAPDIVVEPFDCDPEVARRFVQ